MKLRDLPNELHCEILMWLPPSAEALDCRRTCKLWDTFLAKRHVVLCVHRYHKKLIQCVLVYAFVEDSIGSVLDTATAALTERSAAKDDEEVAAVPVAAVYTFPHCVPATFPPDSSFTCPKNPPEGVVESYSPCALSLSARVRELDCHRLLLSDRCEHDACLETAQDSFSHYMKLLLRYQVKFQEYSFEHRARLQLLRTYINSLEYRVACKQKLLLEHVGYLCLRRTVQILPHLESASTSSLTRSVMNLQLARYRLVQRQIDVERFRADHAYHASTQGLGMKELEVYANFLCRADDTMEEHVSVFRERFVVRGDTWLEGTRLPNTCRIASMAKEEVAEEGTGSSSSPLPDADDNGFHVRFVERVVQAISKVNMQQLQFTEAVKT